MRRCLCAVDANVVFVRRILQNQWAAVKNRTSSTVETLQNVCAAHQQTERGRPKLLPAASRSPLQAPPPPALQSTTVMLLFGFTIPPLLSMQGCVHSSVGSGEQGPALTLRSWDSTGLKRGIMGELRRARRKSGIVPPDDCVCVCVWPTSCLVKVESHCWFNSRSCLLLSGTHIWTVHSSVFTRVVPCTSCWPVCAASIVAMCALSLRSSAYFWEVTSQTEALLIWDPESITITSGGFGEGGGLRLPHA